MFRYSWSINIIICFVYSIHIRPVAIGGSEINKIHGIGQVLVRYRRDYDYENCALRHLFPMRSANFLITVAT
jgi:hypothetical protein